MSSTQNIINIQVAFLAGSNVVSVAVGPSIGPLLLLPPNDPNDPAISPLQTSVYVRPSSEAEPWMDILDFDLDASAHSMATHQTKISYLFEQIVDGGHQDTRGFIDGTFCDIDEECQNLCVSGVCHHGMDGSSCTWDGDCVNSHCDWSFTCQAKVGLGGSCAEHETCDSGYCGYSFTCSDMKPNGDGCQSDDQCDSGRCTWGFICEAKLPSGAPCGAVHHNDGDCESGQCSYSWSGGWRCE